MRFVAQEVRELMAQLGFKTIDEMIGLSGEVLESASVADHWKAKNLDLSKLLFKPEVLSQNGRFQQIEQNHELEETLDKKELLELCRPALESGEKVVAEIEIRNTDRAVGTILGGEISRKYGADGLPDETIQLNFKGTAGQSFGAFVPRGVTLTLEGEANDYVGKGLSGGRIVVFPPKNSTFASHENVIAGNTLLYGATSGEAFISGTAGERFAVRNSGVNAVIEGVGDHGCEYMTGGRVIILGRTGKNFAAGMSGGIAYVFDETGDFPDRCNQQMVSLGGFADEAETEFVKDLVFRHFELTGSSRAEEILGNWEDNISSFVRVIPNDYQRVIESQKAFISEGLSNEEVELAAFYKNATA